MIKHKTDKINRKRKELTKSKQKKERINKAIKHWIERMCRYFLKLENKTEPKYDGNRMTCDFFAKYFLPLKIDCKQPKCPNHF